MCLYPKLIQNKKYLPNKKNGGIAPECKDQRLKYVTASCGHCYECRKQKSRAWQIRMSEELRDNKNAIFATLTINDENYKKLKIQAKSEDDNEIATKAIRLFLERIRKKTGKSIKHWFITELGHENSKRLHLHGIIWNENARELCKEKWEYGYVYIGEYVNEKTINYITKYMTKLDIKNKEFEGKVLCSKGIGANYINRDDAKNNRYKGDKTNETYRLRNGTKINLPIYYRNKILSEEEREELWKTKLDKGIVWVCGEKIDINDEKTYMKTMDYYRSRHIKLSGDNIENWEEKKYKKRLKKQREYYKKANERSAKVGSRPDGDRERPGAMKEIRSTDLKQLELFHRKGLGTNREHPPKGDPPS